MADIRERVKDSQDFSKIIDYYVTAEKLSSLDNEKNHLKDLLRNYLLSKAQTLTVVAGEYDREQLLVDIVHETICHGTVKGLNLIDISAMVTAVLEGTSLLAGEDILDYSDTINKKITTLLYQLTGLFSSRYGLQITAQYIMDTLIQHYHLYNFLMSHEQERVISHESLSVSLPPSHPTSLKGAVLEEEWEKRERLEAVETEYEETKKELKLERENLFKEENEKMDVLYESLNDSLEGQQVNEEELKTAINPLVQSHVTGAQTELLQRLKEEESHFSYCIDKIVAVKGRIIKSPKKGEGGESNERNSLSPVKAIVEEK